jgi:hypothetical protein
MYRQDLHGIIFDTILLCDSFISYTYIMKIKSIISAWLLVCLLQGYTTNAQSPSPYQLPESYRFDYEVTQVLLHKKNISDTSTMHFFYTKSGDYAAVRMSMKENLKRPLMIILTSDGTSIILNEHRKSITIISIRKLMSDLSGINKWIRMDSLMANMRKKTDGKDFQSGKTGNSKQIGGYTSEEYSVSDSNGRRGSVWCANVDFNTQMDYILGAEGGNLLKMMSSKMTTHPVIQALLQPKTLITDIDTRDTTDGHKMNMHTVSINQISISFSTAGYLVNNYSNMSLPEIFRAEMNKNNN